MLITTVAGPHDPTRGHAPALAFRVGCAVPDGLGVPTPAAGSDIEVAAPELEVGTGEVVGIPLQTPPHCDHAPTHLEVRPKTGLAGIVLEEERGVSIQPEPSSRDLDAKTTPVARVTLGVLAPHRVEAVAE